MRVAARRLIGPSRMPPVFCLLPARRLSRRRPCSRRLALAKPAALSLDRGSSELARLRPRFCACAVSAGSQLHHGSCAATRRQAARGCRGQTSSWCRGGAQHRALSTAGEKSRFRNSQGDYSVKLLCPSVPLPLGPSVAASGMSTAELGRSTEPGSRYEFGGRIESVERREAMQEIRFPVEASAESLQDFLERIVENGDGFITVRLREGYYVLDDSIIIDRATLDLTIQGEGDAVLVVRIVASGTYAFHVRQGKLTLTGLDLVHTRYRRDKEEEEEEETLSAFSLAALREFARDKNINMAQLDRNPTLQGQGDEDEDEDEGEGGQGDSVVRAVQQHFDSGACVFVQRQGVAELRHCCLSSEHGFALWVVEKALLTVADSSLSSALRSGLVLFGDCAAQVSRSVVRDCAQHGVCLRGRSSLSLADVHFRGCGARAIYGYQNVAIDMQRCSVTLTMDPLGAAVQVSCEAGLLRLKMRQCVFADNRGVGFKVCGRGGFVSLDIDQQSRDGNTDGECFELIDSEPQETKEEEEEEEKEGEKEGEKGGAGGDASPPGPALSSAPSPSPAHEAACEAAREAEGPHWEFHADDPKKGHGPPCWRRYSSKDSGEIEEALCRLALSGLGLGSGVLGGASSSSMLVLLSRGKYAVNLCTLEQTNTASFHSRAVRRVEAGADC